MQILKFESAWDKTIAEQDREIIKQAFLAAAVADETIQFTPIRVAVNYRGDLLVTVLVHNSQGEKSCMFKDSEIQYIEKEKIMAVHSFTLPSLEIEPKTSMPWTFIFPKDSLNPEIQFKNGYIKMASA